MTATTDNEQSPTTAGSTTPSPIISPSLLSCDLANMAKDAQMVLDLGADWLHLDVMDGHFVPNLSFGPPVISSLRKSVPKAYFDVHLMVTHPMLWVKPMADAGVDSFTFHVESHMPIDSHGGDGISKLIKEIKAHGMKVGISVKPSTPISSILPYIPDVDLVLVMTVEPGFSGQSFMIDMMHKVKQIRTLFPTLNIAVDGGLSPTTVNAAAEVGANVIVSASAIFGSANPGGVIKELRTSVERLQGVQLLKD